MSNEHKLSNVERRAALSLAAVVGLRMFGLFLILPVFALYGEKLPGATPVLIGLAIGIYGITQAIMQIPLGMASDVVGRKVIITLGLLIFALGSVVAAMATDIWGVIWGRALQGAGAVAAASMALAADLSRDSQRAKVMAFIGVSIGFAFLLAILLGPVVAAWRGLSGLFWMTAVLALLAIAVLHLFVATPVGGGQSERRDMGKNLRYVLGRAQLLRLDVGVFLVHLILTATFVALPLMLRDVMGSGADTHWRVYLPVMVLSALLMAPLVMVAEKKRLGRYFASGSLLAVSVCGLLLAFLTHNVWVLALIMMLFFTAFNVLEAVLPSLLSRRVTTRVRGAAMGVYTSSQFFGAFVGGVAGGFALAYGNEAVFLLIAAFALIGVPVLYGLQGSGSGEDHLLQLGEVSSDRAEQLLKRLLAVPGVADAVVVPDEGVAYLRFDEHKLDDSILYDAIGHDRMVG